LILFLLLLNHWFNQLIQKSFECWIYCTTSLLNTSIIKLHITCWFQWFYILILCISRQMMWKYNTLWNWNVQSFWKLLYPKICIILWFWIVAIYNQYNSLCLLLNSRPYSLIFRITLINKIIPDTSQNSIEINLLST